MRTFLFISAIYFTIDISLLIMGSNILAIDPYGYTQYSRNGWYLLIVGVLTWIGYFGCAYWYYTEQKLKRQHKVMPEAMTETIPSFVGDKNQRNSPKHQKRTTSQKRRIRTRESDDETKLYAPNQLSEDISRKRISRCLNCGTINNPTEEFCWNCGKRLVH